MPPVTPSRTRRLRLMTQAAGGSIPVGNASVDARGDRLLFVLGLLGRLLLGRGRPVAPIHELVVDLVHGNPYGLLLAGFHLGAGAAHDLLRAVRGEQDQTELAVDRRGLLSIHLRTFSLAADIRYRRVDVVSRPGTGLPDP